MIASELAREGLKGRNGVGVTGKAVAQVWRRVCRDVDAEADASASARKRKFPSRIAPDWRPQVVPQSSAPIRAGARVAAADSARPEAAQVGGRPDGEPTDFATIDPSGAPLAEGHVLYRGRPMLRRVAEQLAKIDRQAREMDRFK